MQYQLKPYLGFGFGDLISWVAGAQRFRNGVPGKKYCITPSKLVLLGSARLGTIIVKTGQQLLGRFSPLHSSEHRRFQDDVLAYA